MRTTSARREKHKRPLPPGRYVACQAEGLRWCCSHRWLHIVSAAMWTNGIDARLKVSVAKIVMSPKVLVQGTAEAAPR